MDGLQAGCPGYALFSNAGSGSWVTLPMVPMRITLLPIALALSALLAPAQAATPEETEFFEKSVRPVLEEHCVKCHGRDKQKAELRLDSRAAILKGGEN